MKTLALVVVVPALAGAQSLVSCVVINLNERPPFTLVLNLAFIEQFSTDC